MPSISLAQSVRDSSSADTLSTSVDTLNQDFENLIQPSDSILLGNKSNDEILKSKISYSAEDSIDNDIQNRKVYLYGKAKIVYDDITLTAERIIYDFESYTVHAEGIQDTLGTWRGLPIFKQGSSEFESRTMDYNFKSKKAFVKQVKTEIIEGTLTGEQVKTVDDNNVVYIRNAEYCPCDDPNAATRFKINRLKVIKDDKIVSGPGYLALHGIPLPIAFPFGFFPNTEKRQAGIIIPSYGNAFNRGYFLNDLGFYLPIGDNFDTRFLVDIYSRGSLGLTNQTTYVQRYKYRGNFLVDYQKQVSGDKDLNNYAKTNAFNIQWSHTQDPKARPNSNFNASVNAGSTNSFRNNLNASQEDFLQNTFRSSVSYSKNFAGTPFQTSISARHEQNSQTKTYAFTFPDIGLSMARITPLNNLFGDDPKQDFYEKIGVTYSGSFRNQLTAQEDELSFSNWSALQKRVRNGVLHSVNATVPLKAGPLQINPTVRYNERWYFSTVGRSFDEDLQGFRIDTLSGFDRNFDYSMGASVTTKVYGMYSFRNSRVQAIRHTLTPSVSYNYSPAFDTRVYGFFGTDGALSSYSPYENSSVPFTGSGLSQSLNFSLQNNLEAKLLSRGDTTSKFVKVPIIENATATASYNFAADSLKLSNVSVNLRTHISKYANFVSSANFNPYVYVGRENQNPRNVDVLLWDRESKVASFESGTIALNSSGLGSSMFRRSKRLDENNKSDADELEETDGAFNERPVVLENKGLFEDFSIPWNLNFGYALRATKGRRSFMLNEGFGIADSVDIVQSITLSGDFELFKKVRFTFNSGYDFERKEWSTTTIFMRLDLNCWEFNATVIPFGTRQSYRLALFIKSSMLRDLKLERNRNRNDDDFFF